MSALRIVFALAALLTAVAPLRAGDFVVSGRFEYEDKAWDINGWTGADPIRPIRSADVLVMDARRDKVLAKGSTDDAGEFSIPCSTPYASLDVVVRLDSESRERARAQRAFPRLRVMTADGQRYSAFSPEFPGHPTTVDLDVGTTTVMKTVLGAQEGNPFNVFDLAVAAFEYVTGPEVGMTRRARTLRVVWPNPTGSFSVNRRAWIATSDGFDDAVILHEVGHLVHNLYSDSDNPGGIHFFGDSDQDLRLAFGEGWATAFGGTVLDRLDMPAVYMDAKGSAQEAGAQLRLTLETAAPFDVAAAGAGDEIAVACVIYDLLDDVTAGDGEGAVDDDTMVGVADLDGMDPTRAWWRVFTGPLKRARGVNANHIWDHWLQSFEDPEYGRLQDVFEDRQLEFWADSSEPDDTAQEATPITASLVEAWGPDRTLYALPEGAPGPGTGDRDWHAVPLVAGQRVEIETRYPGAVVDAGTQCDPYVALVSPNGKVVARDDDSGYRRNALISDVAVNQTGTWYVVVKSKNRRHRYGRYNLRVQILDD